MFGRNECERNKNGLLGAVVCRFRGLAVIAALGGALIGVAGAADQPEGSSAVAADSWANRGDTGSLDSAIGTFNQKEFRKDTRVLTQLAQAYHWKGETQEVLTAKCDAFWEGHKAGLRALHSNDGFSRTLALDPEDLTGALRYIGRDHAEALYWCARNLYDMGRTADFDDRFKARPITGKNKSVRGYEVMNAVSLSDAVYYQRTKALVGRLIEIGDEVRYGGSQILAGAFYASTPVEFGGDMKLAEKFFSRGIELGKEVAENKLIYAREFAVAKNDRILFAEQMRSILALPEDIIPELAPEQSLAKKRAGMMYENIDSFFPKVTIDTQEAAQERYTPGGAPSAVPAVAPEAQPEGQQEIY